MIRQLWSIAGTESLMARRTWRFWLTVILLLGIVSLAWRDHVAFVKSDLFLAPDHSFGNRPYYQSEVGKPWVQRQVENYGALLSIAIIWICGVALALDCCARLRRTNMDKILFTRPFPTLVLILGRYLGILMVLLPLAAIPWVGFGVLQSLYGHSRVVWQPFIICYFFVVIPALLPLVALGLWVRSVFKHDVVALLVILLVAVLFRFFAPDVVAVLFRNWRALVNSSPSLGARVELVDQIPLFLNSGLLTLLFLLLAPFHLRRQEPQRRILRRRGYRWFAIPTFLRWISDMKMDRNLPVILKLSTFICVTVVSVAGVNTVLEAHDRFQDSKAIQKTQEELRRHPLPVTPCDILSYDIQVALDFKQDRLESSATVRLCSATDHLSVVRFRLNRGLTIREIASPQGPLEYASDLRILSVTLPASLAAGDPFQIHLRAEGPLLDSSGLRRRFHADFGSLGSGDLWYPTQYKPVLTAEGRSAPVVKPDLFDASVTVTLPTGSQIVFPGEQVTHEDQGDLYRETYRTSHPLGQLQLLWGKYSKIDGRLAGVPCHFFYLPGHRYQAQVYLEEMRGRQADAREKIGPFPFPQMVLCEVPTDMTYPLRENMPALLTVNEGDLVYLHEGIWKLDRYDVKPTQVDFYAQLPGVIRRLNDRYRYFLVENYFEKTFHPTGPYAFWLDSYLATYVQKLLQPNAWRRRWQLNYDSGFLPRTLPGALARPILKCREEEPGSNAERLRGEGVFRMLHHLLGDEAWWTFIRRLVDEYRFKDVSDRDVIRLANEVSGKSLDWFFEQWLYSGVLPKYEITLAEATPVKKPGKLRLQYQISIKVKNHGTGRMAVPIYVETERDHILRDVWLDTGQEGSLNIVAPDRPVFTMVDPENWVLQEPMFDEKNRTRAHSERKFEFYQGGETIP